VLAASLALGAAAPAFAQSVGDEQYRDPFAGEEQTQDESGGGGNTPAPAPAPAPAPTTTPPTDSTGEPVATVAGTLPRTGAESAWIAAIGAVLIAAGAGLRRTART
jgi:LPXTG-motif cell wall-anchored protein